MRLSWSTNVNIVTPRRTYSSLSLHLLAYTVVACFVAVSAIFFALCFSAHSLLATRPRSAASILALLAASSFSLRSFSRAAIAFLGLANSSLPLNF